ncbi:MAG: HD domain-containing protein, partial [Verrucomicrobiae bacterium]|nr:HD domain-containing protein [Verrucomicrobiae bacterium]
MNQNLLPTEPTDGFPYLWGGRFISFSSACKHFLAVGSTGSGKTVLISLLMKEIMRVIAQEDDADVRALVYDSKTDLLKTFAASDYERDNPLPHHEAKLASIPSLRELVETRRDRVIDDLRVLEDSPTLHSQVVTQHFRSSYTKPLFEGTHLRGFLFFDSPEPAYFTAGVVERLQIFSDLAALLLAMALHPARLLQSALYAATHVSHTRDPETGAHLERMARYARTIANELAESHSLSSAFIEHLLVFAPLHDVGKVGVPDSVLLKPGRLTDEEMVIMRGHVDKGVEMIDGLLDSIGLEAVPYVGMLRNIIQGHHESWDGSGYPRGIAGHDIPIEA